MTHSSQTNQQAPQSAEVDFELSTTIHQQNELIWIQPVCDYFQIGRKWQVEVIRRDPFLASEVKKTSHELLFGDKKSRLSLPKKAFIRWVQLINPEIVKPQLKDNLIRFQNIVFDLLYGAAEQQQLEAEMYHEIVQLQSERESINARLKTLRAELQRHWAKKYGQQELPFANNKSLGAIV